MRDNNSNIEEVANSYKVQKDQNRKVDYVLNSVETELDLLLKESNESSDFLDSLLKQADELSPSMGFSVSDVTDEELFEGLERIALNDYEQATIAVPSFEIIDTVDIQGSWEKYYDSVKKYAVDNNVDLFSDPFSDMLTESEKDSLGQRVRDDYMMKKAQCDKYDYMIAVTCGLIAGVIDSFFVGAPNVPGEKETSKIGTWTDKQSDNYIEWLSKTLWNSDSKKRNELIGKYGNNKKRLSEELKKAGIPYNQNLNKAPDTLQGCIQYLEKKFGVNYDASSAAFVEESNVLKGMTPKNHHVMSLAHSPSIIGLVFSIIDQFTGKATFADNGRLIRVTPKGKKNEIDNFELRGGSFPTKLLCGTINWLGHLASDLVGSNTTRSQEGKRGMGLPAPFMEIMQLSDFTLPDAEGKKMTIGELTLKIYENGYDARFSAACAIPVVIGEFLTRFLWTLKSRYYHKNSWKDSIPFGNKPELRRMLLVSHGTLCFIDVTDAAIRSYDLVTFSLHLNSVAWARLAISGLQEVRAIYKDNLIDITALEDDLDKEWNRLYVEMSKS